MNYADPLLPAPGGGVLVVGFAVTGQAVAAVLVAAGYRVRAIDDHVGEGSPAAAVARDLGVELDCRPSPARARSLAGRADLVVLSPGVPPSHPVLSSGPLDRVVSEVELGWSLLGDAASRVVAVTGTNGKTTVTSMVTAMLQASGVGAVAAGNIGTPLVQVAHDLRARRDHWSTGAPGSPRASSVGDADDRPVVVAEVSSFQLAWTRTLRPDVACWLNFAEDHLDWHPDMCHYAASKARIWRNQRAGDVAVVNLEDPAVMRAAADAPSQVVTFGVSEGDYQVRRGVLVGPGGVPILGVAELPRCFPHDLANAAASTAVALAAGADLEGCKRALLRGVPMPHRIERVAQAGGVTYLDDSKATTPSAVVAALAGLDSVVLIAGGRNKGLDLTAIARGLVLEQDAGPGAGARRLRAVVAIGESAAEVERAFAELCPVRIAHSMDEAVAAASSLARAGDAVLLSPGCASFDWYRSYGERGDDFARAVHAHLATAAGGRRRES